MKLRPYQEEGRDFLAARSRALLADEMRVGKTPQAILAFDKIGAKRALVACPAIACEHWKREVAKWSPERPPAHVCGPRAKLPPADFQGVVIVSYSRLVDMRLDLGAQRWDVLVLDEGHYAKNPEAKRTHAIYGRGGVGYAAARIWVLTGTPATRHAGELWPMLRAFGATRYRYDEFISRYCTVHPLTGNVTGTRTEMADELNAMLSGIMLRRTRRMVAPEMPAISFDFLEVEGAAPADLPLPPGMVDDDLAEYIARNAGKMVSERQAVASAKVAPLVENARFVLENGLLDRTVVFGHHVEPLGMVAAALRAHGHRVGLITGATATKERAAICDAFRGGGLDAIVANIIAAGTAVDMSAASHGFFLELSWVPGDNLQAANRLVSMQKAEPVTLDIVTWPGSFDDRIQRVVSRRVAELGAFLPT